MAGGRARAALAASGQLRDTTWHDIKQCEYCGRAIMVNNYDDRKSRTPKFLGLIICPWCDPRDTDDQWLWREEPRGEKPKIRHPVLYRTIISTWIARSVAKGGLGEPMNKQALKFWTDEGRPRDAEVPVQDTTVLTPGRRP